MSLQAVDVYVGCGEQRMNTFLRKNFLRNMEQDSTVVFLKKRYMGM
jgi:hypothetical protein